MSDERTAESLNIRGTKWETAQLNTTCGYLQQVGLIVGSPRATECAEILKIIRDGQANPIVSCPTLAHIASKYPIFCSDCAPAIGHVSPQKMIFCLHEADSSTPTWVAAYFGIGFMLAKLGRPNTLEEATTLLDDLTDEASVYQLMQLSDMPGSNSPLAN